MPIKVLFKILPKIKNELGIGLKLLQSHTLKRYFREQFKKKLDGQLLVKIQNSKTFIQVHRQQNGSMTLMKLVVSLFITLKFTLSLTVNTKNQSDKSHRVTLA